jgi:hypothetical protein
MSAEMSTQPSQPAASAPAPDPSKPPCPTSECSYPLDLQQREPMVYRCAMCWKWFDGELKRL